MLSYLIGQGWFPFNPSNRGRMHPSAWSETESVGEMGHIVEEQKFEKQVSQYITSARVGDVGQVRTI